MSKRAPTFGDRGEVRRSHTAPRGVGLTQPPEFIAEDLTGRIEGEELLRARERRTTPDRLTRLEAFKDATIAVHAAMSTKLDMLVKAAEDTEEYRRQREEREAALAERDRVRKWIVGVIGAIVAGVVTVIGALR